MIGQRGWIEKNIASRFSTGRKKKGNPGVKSIIAIGTRVGLDGAVLYPRNTNKLLHGFSHAATN